MNETKIARVALVGLGPIGVEVARAVLARSEIQILGAADPAPDKAGKDLRELVSSKGGDGPFPIAPSARELYEKSASERGRSDVVLLCTGSRLDSVAPQIEGAVAAGVHAGLVMDRLVLAVAGACVKVERVKVTRVVDAAKRRGPLRAKVGAGLSKEEFESGVAARKLGHVGLSESAAMIALGLGLPIGEISETIEPVLALRDTEGVVAGRVLGLHQIARVRAGGEIKVELDLTMAVGVPEAFDSIEIHGDPPVNLTVTGGFHGDRATVGCVVNAIPFIVAAPPGVQTVVTLPLFGLLPQR